MHEPGNKLVGVFALGTQKGELNLFVRCWENFNYLSGFCQCSGWENAKCCRFSLAVWIGGQPEQVLAMGWEVTSAGWQLWCTQSIPSTQLHQEACGLLCSEDLQGWKLSSLCVGGRGPLGSCSSLSKLSSLQLMDRVHTTGRGVPGRAGNLQLEGSSTALQCSTVCGCSFWAARWPRSSRLDAIHRYFKDGFKEFNVRIWQCCSFQTLIKLAWLMRCFTLLPPPPCFFVLYGYLCSSPQYFTVFELLSTGMKVKTWKSGAVKVSLLRGMWRGV